MSRVPFAKYNRSLKSALLCSLFFSLAAPSAVVTEAEAGGSREKKKIKRLNAQLRIMAQRVAKLENQMVQKPWIQDQEGRFQEQEDRIQELEDQLLVQEDWIPATIDPSDWTTAGPPYAPPGYYKDALGIVHLQGAFSSGGGEIFVLPEGYRPSHLKQYGRTGNGKVEVFPDGQVKGTNPSIFFSIEGISFRAVP